jgi:hypothetical protein
VPPHIRENSQCHSALAAFDLTSARAHDCLEGSLDCQAKILEGFYDTGLR